MAWNLFGGKKKSEKSAKIQAKAAMPPIMAPDESVEAPPRGKSPGDQTSPARIKWMR